MISSGKETVPLASWPVRDRVEALKRIAPRKKVEEILQDSRGAQTYCRRLPAWFVVWLVIGLGLFARDSYRQVFRWLTPFRKGGTPGRSTLCQARKRVGVAPLRRLCEAVVVLLGKPATPGAFYQGLRLMSIDGFVLDLPDSEANVRAFSRPGSGRTAGAFPQARVVSLCETGSHVLWRSLIKPCHRGEIAMARVLLRYLLASMLLLWDRGFLSYDLVQQVLQRRAQLLARVKTNLVFTPLEHLPDGSYLAKLYPSPKHRRLDREGILVRIIDYTFEDPQRPGSGEKNRLLTTLLDAAAHPAPGLIVLYHERWEEEVTIDEFKTHQRERPVLRSQTPAGVVQEIYGLLIGHYLIRVLMHQAAAQRGVDPQRISFVNALKILRCRLPECPSSHRGLGAWLRRVVDEISEEILEPRRNRINPRVIRKKMSNWPKKKPEHRHYPQPEKEFCEAIAVLH